jgi:hypothetical protein
VKPKTKIWRTLIGVGIITLSLGVGMDVFEIRPKEGSVVLSKLETVKSILIPRPEPDVDYLSSVVTPIEGYKIELDWGDVGKKIVEAGGIDMSKFLENYTDVKWQDELDYLTSGGQKKIEITADNAYFWVNTLWALGLTQDSKVLTEGIMGTKYEDKIGNFASTGGWTLGSKDSMSLYSSTQIIDLDADEHARVMGITSGIFRPCCGNPTSFPDCNHGMAILGLVELMVDQGFSDEEIYKASLAFNSYWFPQTYIDLAYYFQTKENTLWKDVDARRVLSAEYSSAPGYRAIKKEIGNIPGASVQGGSCGA